MVSKNSHVEPLHHPSHESAVHAHLPLAPQAWPVEHAEQAAPAAPQLIAD
jgi:hypothetical protein